MKGSKTKDETEEMKENGRRKAPKVDVFASKHALHQPPTKSIVPHFISSKCYSVMFFKKSLCTKLACAC